jgi:hypothetical protein
VEWINSIFRTLFAVLLSPLAGHSAFCSLISFSALASVLAIFLFERLSNRAARQQSLRRLGASLLAIRLYADEPRVVMQSLLGVVTANLQLLAAAAVPIAVMAPIFLLVYAQLNVFFGSTPLSVGVARVLTVRLTNLENGWPDVEVKTPPFVTLDSPPVHVFDEKEISWRVRATEVSHGMLKIIIGNEVIEKTIDSRPWPRYFSSVRMQSLAGAMQYPGESRLPPGLIAEVRIVEPARPISYLGISLAWEWWFTIFALLLALPVSWGFSRLLHRP